MKRVPLVALLMAMPLLAQGPLQSRSPLAGAAVAMMVDGGLGGPEAATRVHRNGFSLAPTVGLPVAVGQPDLAAVFQAWGAPAGLDADDWSLGRDDVLVNDNGIVEVPSGAWGVLSFSLRAGATGSGSASSRITQELLGGGNVASALFAWMLPGSAIPPQFFGPAERSHSAAELGIPAGNLDVDAVDLPAMLGRDQVGLVATDPQFSTLLVQPESLYFTVSHATRNLVPPVWWGAFANSTSGATIFVTRRPSPTANWTRPAVFRNWSQLGLSQSEDIDGLAYDRERGKLLFSCVGTARDQFLYLNIGTDGPGVPIPVVTAAGGPPVSTQVGKGQNDDVDAVCTLDPRIGTQGLPPGGDDFGSSCGTPRPGLLGVPQIHASAYRRYQGGLNRFYDSWMIGWPPLTGITAGIAVPFVTLNNDPTLFLAGPIQLRDVNPAVPGDPRSVSVPIPPGLSMSGQRVTFRWAAFDAAFTELAEAWPVLVFL